MAGPPPPPHLARIPPTRPASDGVRVLAGLPYAALPGARPLELDLYLPPGGPAPVVLFLHGGGWSLGSRHSAGPAYAGDDLTPFERVARSGVAVASADYRLSGEATWPAPLHDAKAAVRWLRRRAPELGVLDRVAAWGESAGGHLAALLGLTAGTDLDGDVGTTGPSAAVDAVVAWYAPSDVAAVATDTGVDPHDPGTREAGLLGAAPAAAPDLAAEASPLTHACADAPPFLLLHGRADRAVPHVQSERLRSALRAAGAQAELVSYDDADHLWRGSSTAPADALDRTTGFLRHHLRIP